MKHRLPVINPDRDGNPVDLGSMYMMRHYFIDKKLRGLEKNTKVLQYLGRVILYENILSYQLSYLIRAIQNQINSKLKKKRLFIKTDDPIDLLGSNLTFGALVFRLKSLSPKNILLADLRKFNEDRNTLTHYMHLGFSNTKDISLKARGLAVRAGGLIDRVASQREKVTPKFKVRIPKVINISELVRFMKERDIALYPFSDKTEDNLKTFNTRRKSV